MAELIPTVVTLEGVDDDAATAYVFCESRLVDRGEIRDGQVTIGFTEEDEQYEGEHHVIAGTKTYTLGVRNLGVGVVLDGVPIARLEGQRLSERLDLPGYEGLVKAGKLSLRTTPIGHAPATAIPMNRVLSRFTARYFQVDAGSLLLARPERWLPGYMLEYDVSFEPAGWALDDWVSTTSLAPHEDQVHTESLVDLSSSAEQNQRIQDLIKHRQVDDGRATTAEDLATRTDATSSAKGFDLGLGGTSDSSTTTDLINPVKAIAEAVTGALQIGVNWSSANNREEQQNALRRSVTEHFRRDTSQFRDGTATASAQTLAAVDDRRSLAAVRNLTAHELNLATYSVVKQWRVAAVVDDCKPVVLVPIDEVNVDFTTSDVLVHSRALQLALLDDSFRDTIRDVARNHDPHQAVITIPPPTSNSPGGQTLVTITGEATFSDPADGRHAEVHVQASFRTSGDEYEWLGHEVDAFDTSVTTPIEIPIDRPLQRYGGARVLFRNSRLPWSDQTTVLRTLRLVGELDDGTTVTLFDGRDIDVEAGGEEFLPRAVPQDDVPGAPPLASTEASAGDRLLRHLNQRRAYYRLAIDLQQDSATRFERLRARCTVGMEDCAEEETADVTPVDFDPVGVIGGYLAFLADPSVLAPDERSARGVDGAQQRFLVSTPAGGTFTEAILGVTSTPPSESAEAPRVPTSPTGASPTYLWPERVVPSPATISTILSPTGPPPAPADGPTTGAAELTTDTGAADEAETARGKTAGAATTNKTIPPKQNEDESGAGGSEAGGAAADTAEAGG